MIIVDAKSRLAIARDEANALVARIYPQMAKAERENVVRKIILAVAPSIQGLSRATIGKLDTIFERCS